MSVEREIEEEQRDSAHVLSGKKNTQLQEKETGKKTGRLLTKSA